jgi:hypothetical protein
MSIHPFPSYPKPDIPLGFKYPVSNVKQTYKELCTEEDAELILSYIPIVYVNNVSTWIDPESGKHVITIIDDIQSFVWEALRKGLQRRVHRNLMTLYEEEEAKRREKGE